jgi:hypothetical protein
MRISVLPVTAISSYPEFMYREMSVRKEAVI